MGLEDRLDIELFGENDTNMFCFNQLAKTSFSEMNEKQGGNSDPSELHPKTHTFKENCRK